MDPWVQAHDTLGSGVWSWVVVRGILICIYMRVTSECTAGPGNRGMLEDVQAEVWLPRSAA